jgi:hypothetical protein
MTPCSLAEVGSVVFRIACKQSDYTASYLREPQTQYSQPGESNFKSPFLGEMQIRTCVKSELYTLGGTEQNEGKLDETVRS